ncbi:MAG: ATP-dependent ligase, partial [Glaciihabitans sp.]|nr:ATP-dependent ligase [Glaciihabitans sp.]
MGKLIYGHSDVVIDLDDRHLAHLQVVIGAKLRRSESFFFTWKKDAVGDGQRGSIWLEKS